MDFKKFYEEQADYTGFRTDPEKRDEYIKKVRWKVNELIKVIPAGYHFENILEIGCAMGILLDQISTRLSIFKRFGLDISEENIKMARLLYPESVFYSQTVEEFALKTPEEKFNLILLSDIIEHIPDDVAFLKTVGKLSSFVLVNLPLEKCFKNRNRKYGETDSSGHLRWYDREIADALFRKSGFEIIRSFTSNSLNDQIYFALYKKNRKERLKKKILPLRLFWTLFYFGEDQIKYISKPLYNRIYGANYFAFLKSKN
jgi:hypothetical protein